MIWLMPGDGVQKHRRGGGLEAIVRRAVAPQAYLGNSGATVCARLFVAF